MNDYVSIIVPIYNAEETIERTLNSIISQSYSNLEIILVNDGSTDNSLDICQKYSNIDSRIVVISQKNKGVGEARNTGLDVAKGEYICFVDADDKIDSNYILEMYGTAKLLKCDVVISKIKCVSDNDIFEPYDFNEKNLAYSKKEFIKKFLNFEIGGAVWGKLFCKKAINKHQFRGINVNEDFIFCWDIIKNANSFSINSDTYYSYYLNTKKSLSKSRFSLENMSMIEHIDIVLNDIRQMTPELLVDANNYYSACLLHNLIIYYNYILQDNCDNLYLDAVTEMLNRANQVQKIEHYFLLTENGIDMCEITDEIRKTIAKRWQKWL